MRYFDLVEESMGKSLDVVAAENNTTVDIIKLILNHVKSKEPRCSVCAINNEMFRLLAEERLTTRQIADMFITDHINIDIRLREFCKKIGANFSKIREENEILYKEKTINESVKEFPKITCEFDEGDDVFFENRYFDYFLNGNENVQMTRAKVIAVNLKDVPFPSAKIEFDGHFGKIFSIVHSGTIKKVLKNEKKSKTAA